MKYLEVSDLAAGMYDGEERGGLVCPFCGGGSSKDLAFSIRRDGTKLLYICHRASCGAKGAVLVGAGACVSRPSKPKRSISVYPKPLPSAVSEQIVERYKLSAAEVARADMGWTTAFSSEGRGRVTVPMLRPDGSVRGYLLRALDGKQHPKALIFPNEGEPRVGWYRRASRTAPTIIVEDAFSALRASSYCHAVWLGGTTISEQVAQEIAATPSGTRYLMLDKDATRQAVRLALQWSSLMKMQVVPIPKDLKDMSTDELESFLTHNTEIMNGVTTAKGSSG